MTSEDSAEEALRRERPWMYDTARDASTGGALHQSEPFRGRTLQLIAELEKMDGYLSMQQWVDTRLVTVNSEELWQAAVEHPCGTACCLAGKAALMPVFREQGFRLNPDICSNTHRLYSSSIVFQTQPYVFFGYSLYSAVFTGIWCIKHLHTIAQAAELLRCFLADFEEASRRRTAWLPPATARDRIKAMFDGHDKTFPVTRTKQKLSGNSDAAWTTYSDDQSQPQSNGW